MARTTTTRKNTARRAAMDPTSVSPELQPKWYVVDAEGKTLGRLSTSIAMHLMGKHRPHYAPHQFFGDHVVVVNAGKIKVTGRKLDQKIYYWHTSYPGGLKELPLRKALAEHPVKVIQWAVEGMLPKNRIGKRMIRCLKLYAGPEHPHVAQRPEPLQSPAARKSA